MTSQLSFTLTMSGVVVGRSELETRDTSRRVASGAFRPGLGYELTQPVFALYQPEVADAAGLVRYRKAREALKLQLADRSGATVRVRELHIRRSTDQEASDSGLILEVITDDPLIWTSTT